MLIPKVFYYFLAFRKIQEEQFLLAKINRLKYLSWYFNFRKEIRRWAELCIDVFLFILLVFYSVSLTHFLFIKSSIG